MKNGKDEKKNFFCLLFPKKKIFYWKLKRSASFGLGCVYFLSFFSFNAIELSVLENPKWRTRKENKKEKGKNASSCTVRYPKVLTLFLSSFENDIDQRLVPHLFDATTCNPHILSLKKYFHTRIYNYIENNVLSFEETTTNESSSKKCVYFRYKNVFMDFHGPLLWQLFRKISSNCNGQNSSRIIKNKSMEHPNEYSNAN